MERRDRVPRRSSLDAVSNSGYHPVSFSSSLLDAIYRSMDDDDDDDDRAGGHCERWDAGGGAVAGGGATGDQPRRVSAHAAAPGRHNDPTDRFPGDQCLLATVERKERTTITDKVVLHRHHQHHGSMADEHNRRPRRHCIVEQQRQQRERVFFSNSTSSSSDSSYGEFSSESESVVLAAPPRPKPIRTLDPATVRSSEQSTPEWNKTNKDDSIRSRFRASMFYSEVKNAKTPVSPGARLASFLNNLFAAAGTRKVKTSMAANSATVDGLSRRGDESGCSSASSYSRSCLVKTPSTRGKASPSSTGAKRSVRFSPASVVVDDDCRPYRQKYAYRVDPPVKETPPCYLPASAEERKRVAEAARDLIRGYAEKVVMGISGGEVREHVAVDEEEEDDDTWSYSSSDLFELENLAADGAGERRYLDELPVYGTTRLQVWT